jgi:hypothetical protein
MKELAQAFLIGCGMLGLLVSVIPAIYGWLLHRGFGGELTRSDREILYSPLVCAAAIVVGFVWRARTKKKEPRRSPDRLTEDPGGSDAA